MAELIEAAGLRKAYGDTVAVHDVSLSVRRGELYMLMGLSGSGKSTVLRMLNGLVEPTSGTVTLDGRELSTFAPAELREVRNRRISMVFQHFALFPHRTVRENAGFGLRIRGESRGALRERAQHALETVGLADWGDAYPAQLSGGMKQRVGLARALATDAEVLLMDEPFSALDPLIRREMQDLLLHVRDGISRTIVFVTHDLNEAMRVGDRITVLREGRVAQTGTTAEILGAPADDYVRRFVSDVDRTRVLTVRDLMDPGEGAGDPVAPEATLGEFAGRLAHERSLQVVEDGRVLGTVSGASVLEALAHEMAV